MTQNQFLNPGPDIGHVRDHIVGLGQDLLPYRERQLVPAQHHGSAKLLHDKAIGRGLSGEHRAAIIEVSLMGMWMLGALKQPISLHGWGVRPAGYLKAGRNPAPPGSRAFSVSIESKRGSGFLI